MIVKPGPHCMKPRIQCPDSELTYCVCQGVEASKPTQPEEAAGAPEEGGEGEEDCSADFKPLVQLSEVESVSGEEAEAQLCDLCAPAPTYEDLQEAVPAYLADSIT